MNNKDGVLFHEVQPARMWWIWLVVLAVAALGWGFFIAQIVFRTPIGTNPASDLVVEIIWIVFGIAFPLFFYSMKLITAVRTDAVYLRLFPVWSRTIPLKDIVTHEARQYRPIAEYGGWGIRVARHKKRAYNMTGNRGVELELTDGTHLLIGSQRPEELASAVAAAKAST